MATKPLDKEFIQGIVDTWISLGGPDNCTLTALSHHLKINRSTLSGYLNFSAKALGIVVPCKSDAGEPAASSPEGDALKHQVATLKAQLTAYQKDELTARYVRTKIMGLAEAQPTPPVWLVANKASKSSPGVPTLLCSDWHWGEVIQASQVGGVNAYNLEIAHARAKRLVSVAIDLLNNHMVNPKYPGFIFALGGDMISGDIHDELKETNDIPLVPAVLDLFGVLIWCVETLADSFGRIFVPCVTGNHGRNTQKIRAKDRAFTSFDWMLYCMLERHFQNDKRVTFMVPDGPDAFYKVYEHRYLLTHGDQFRGGDGMIGALGPIIRGDHKKRSRNNQVGLGYDTLVLGHWHQLIQMNRLIVNGSLCGYNEYAYAGNFPFETPKQALWVTHPQHGITFSIPVHVGDTATPSEATPWVSIK
jgi:hypothetical protein